MKVIIPEDIEPRQRDYRDRRDALLRGLHQPRPNVDRGKRKLLERRDVMRRREFLGSASLFLAGSAWCRAANAERETPAIALKSLDGGMVDIDRSALTELKESLSGSLVTEGPD